MRSAALIVLILCSLGLADAIEQRTEARIAATAK